MTPRVSHSALMRRPINTSNAAADAEEFAVSYHALMAAMHAAERVGRDSGNATAFAEIERVAKAQSDRVESPFRWPNFQR